METDLMPPPAASDPVARLLTLGPPQDPWPDYPARFGLSAADLPALLVLAQDASEWQAAGSQSPRRFGPIHAWRALGQLHALEALPLLLGLFAWGEAYNCDAATEDLPAAIALLGLPAVPALADFLANPRENLWSRVLAADALEAMGRGQPAAAPACAAALARALTSYRSNDPTLNGFLIKSLATLRQPATYPLVQAAFRARLVDLSVLGDWEDFQAAAGA